MLLLNNTSLCAWYTVRPNNTTILEFGAEKGPCKEMGGSCLKNSKGPEIFHQSPFKSQRWGRGVVSRANLLVSDPLFLRSGHGQVTFLYISSKQMLFSVLTRKGKVPRHSVHHPRSQSWLRGSRAQLAAPSGPGPKTLLSCRLWGSQAPYPTGPPSPPATQMRGHRVPQTATQADDHCY